MTRTDYRPLTPVEAEQRLRRTANNLERETTEYETVAVDAAKAESAWKLHEAKVIVSRDGGSVAEAERTAKNDAPDLYRAYKIADALERATKERLRSTQAQMSAFQTVSGALRDQYKSINQAGHGA